MKRQIVLDTETTGIGVEQGHRVIEIGCVELLDRQLTGTQYHVYLNPERPVDIGAFRVHGLSAEFLQNKPRFSEVVLEFLEFIEGSELIIHNAPFDLGFLNSELTYVQETRTIESFCTVLDTLTLARSMHPGQRNSLDALCKRYDIDNSNRLKHGALLDAEILALVYLAMTGGQSTLFGGFDLLSKPEPSLTQKAKVLELKNPRLIKPSLEELEQHKALIRFIYEQSQVNHWEEACEEA